MRARFAAVFAVFLVATASPAAGQSVGRMLEADVKDFGRDIWAIWTSPFDASGRDWALAGAAIAAHAAVFPVDDNIDRWAVRDSASALFDALKPFRRGGFLFQGNKLVPVAGAVLIAGYVTKNQDIRDGIYGCGASWLSNNVLRHQVLYRFVRRERPEPDKEHDNPAPPAKEGDQYDFSLSWGDSSWAHNSWPGGHVANITACASFFNHRYDMGFAGPLLYVMAAGVGVGRIADRAHWASDQLLGAIFGYAIGREVARRQLKREERRRLEQSEASSLPVHPQGGFYLINDPVRGVGLGWQRSF